MSKFVVDPDTLQYVSNALAALSGEFAGIVAMTNGLTAQELGGQSVLQHLEDFDASWRYGRMVIDEEIVGMSKRLATAKQVYELIDQRIQEGATGTIDLGRWGTAHIGSRTGTGTTTVGGGGSGAGHGRHGGGHNGSGTGTTRIGGGPGTGTGTTIGGGGSGSGHRGDHHGSGTGTTTIDGGRNVVVRSSLLTSDQETFVGKLAALTGLSPRVIGAWCLAEESGSAARAREAENNNNWLNIGYFDSGRGAISYERAFENPTTAAEQTAKFLEGSWGGASTGIQNILHAGSDPERQIEAIASSGWASSGYDGGATLRATYGELSGMSVTYPE